MDSLTRIPKRNAAIDFFHYKKKFKLLFDNQIQILVIYKPALDPELGQQQWNHFEKATKTKLRIILAPTTKSQAQIKAAGNYSIQTTRML